MINLVRSFFRSTMSDEARHILSLLDDRSKWTYRKGDANTWPGIRCENVVLKPTWDFVHAYIDGSCVTAAFESHEQIALHRKAQWVLFLLESEHRRAETERKKSEAKELVKRLLGVGRSPT